MNSKANITYTFRIWRRDPGTALVVILSLALGIGANTTIFSVINSIRTFEFPFEEPDRLVVLSLTNPARGIDWDIPAFETISAILKEGQSFERFGFFHQWPDPATVSGETGAVRVTYQPIDVNLFSVLGVTPLLGRDYEPDDLSDVIKRKEIRPIVISHDFWQRQLGEDPEVLGRDLRIDGAPRTVIGVMPADLRIAPWVGDVAYWAANDLSRIPESRWLIPVGRLHPESTIEQAKTEATMIHRGILDSRDEDPAGWDMQVESLHKAYFGETEEELLLLLGAVSFVLLIACVNVANLLLARGAMRRKELIVRASVGAEPIHLFRQLLTESTLLSLVGGLVGAGLAIWGNQIFTSLAPQGLLATIGEVAIDLRVLVFTFVLSLATGVLFGLLPALKAYRVDLVDALRERRGGAGGPTRRRTRSLLLAAEVALAVTLLIGAGLLMRSLIRERNEIPGFNTKNLLTADIRLGDAKYYERTPTDIARVTPQCARFFERILEEIGNLPGVRKAGIIGHLPFGVWEYPFDVVGRAPLEPGSEPTADLNEVDPQLFETLEIPLLSGRYLSDADVNGSPWVVVINKTFAERHFPNEDPLGQLIQVTHPGGASGIKVQEPRQREIVGVVADVKYPNYVERPPAAMYIPYRQHLWEYTGGDQMQHVFKTLVVRTSVDPLALVRQIEEVMEKADPDQAFDRVMTMDQRIAGSYSVAQSRFLARLFGIFGGLALLLAIVGIYGVTFYFVNERHNEFGIRLSLGARNRDLISMLLRQSLTPVVLGITFGIAGGLAVSALLNSFFWRLTSFDPLAVGGVLALMLAAAALGAYLPARRATRVDPLKALRCE